MKMLQFNMNVHALVVLTSAGVDIVEGYEAQFSTNLQKFKGCSPGSRLIMPLWEIMQIFGEHLSNGSPIPFKDNKISFEIRK